jgi:hypothetical protein
VVLFLSIFKLLKEMVIVCMKRWIQKHIFPVGVVVCCLFALFIHIIFKIEAPNAWFLPEWDAADILTYVSTAVLSILALWQNQRFKEENDKAQQRLESISVAANDLNIIIRIAENETQFIGRLETAFHDLLDAISIERIAMSFQDRDDDSRFKNKILSQINRAIDNLVAVHGSGYIIQAHPTNPLIEECVDMAKTVSNSVSKAVNQKANARQFAEVLECLIEPYTNLSISLNHHLSVRRAILNTVLLEKLSLGDIKEIYDSPLFEQREKE